MPAPGLMLCKLHLGVETRNEFWDYVVAIDLYGVLKTWKGDRFRAYKSPVVQYKIGMACCEEDAKQRALNIHAITP